MLFHSRATVDNNYVLCYPEEIEERIFKSFFFVVVLLFFFLLKKINGTVEMASAAHS